MASTELVVAFEAKIDGLTTSLKRVTEQVKNLEDAAKDTGRGVQSSVDDMNRSFTNALSGMITFRNFFIAMWATDKIVQAALAVDDMNASINRLKAITGSTLPQARDQMFALAEIASRTGQPLNDMVNQFQRFYVATAQLGTSRAQLESLVNVLAGFAQLSGQRPQEASAAITQLSQALASGRLNGDELKSIMENMPQLAIAIARELGVSVGELRKMGEEGKLVADRVLPAILNSAGRQQAQLAQLPITLRQGWQAFSDAAVLAIQTVDSKIGASEWVARLFQRTGEIIRSGAVAMEGTGPNAGNESALTNLNNQARALNAELDRNLRTLREIQNNPAGRNGGAIDPQNLERAIERQRARLQALNQEIEGRMSGAAGQSVTQDLERRNQAIVAQAGAAATASRTLLEQAFPADKARREHADRMAEIQQRFEAQNRLALQGRTVAEQEAGQAAARAGRAREEAASRAILNRELESASAGARADAARLEREDEQRARAAERAAAAERERAAVIARAGGSGIEGLIEAYQRWNTATEQANSNYEAFANRVAGNSELAAVGFRAVVREAEVVTQSMLRLGGDPAQAMEVMNAELVKFRDIMIAAADGSEQSIARINAAFESVSAQGVASLERLRERAESTWNDIAAKGIKTFAQDLSGAIVDFAMGAKQNFTEMTANFLANIAKMILNMMILRAIASSLSAIGMPGLGNMLVPGINPKARMSGGPVTAGQPYIVGEKRPELFIPGSSGYIAPRVPGGGGGDTNVTIINNSRAQMTQSQTPNASGGMDINILVEDAVNNAVAAGRFDRTFGATFGVRRVGRN